MTRKQVKGNAYKGASKQGRSGKPREYSNAREASAGRGERAQGSGAGRGQERSERGQGAAGRGGQGRSASGQASGWQDRGGRGQGTGERGQSGRGQERGGRQQVGSNRGPVRGEREHVEARSGFVQGEHGQTEATHTQARAPRGQERSERSQGGTARGGQKRGGRGQVGSNRGHVDRERGQGGAGRGQERVAHSQASTIRGEQERSGRGLVQGERGQSGAAQAQVSIATGQAASKQLAQKPSPSARRSSPASTGIYSKNEVVTAEIIGLTHDGDGVGRTDKGYTLFVPQALPGESVEAKVLKSKKSYGFGKLLSLNTTSTHRIEPPCPIYYKCGGCQLQHYDYEEQLKWKRQHVVDSLTRIGKLKVQGEPVAHGSEQEGAEFAEIEADQQHEIIVHPTVGMENPWYYRNKAALPIGATEDGELIGGFYAKGSHRIIDMDVCLIQKELNDDVLAIVKEIARELRIEPYQEESASGVLRHIMTRFGVVTGEVMVVLITNTSTLPRKAEFVEQLRKRVPNLKSIVHNVNNKVTNAIFGDRTEVIWGSEVIYDELDGLRFAISARSFYQVNPEQTITLYRKAVEYAALTGKEQVIDAYCGIGTISLFLARQAAHVYGVEIVPEAIEDAKRNAALNELDNTTFEAGPAEVVIPRWKQEGMNADVIVVDPPRKGCDEALLQTILEIKPERVVYVSCNPSTLARDLRVLEDGGYRTVEVTPVDMFPQTGHVECVILMVRK